MLRFIKTLDWVLISSVVTLGVLGVVTMGSFSFDDYFAPRQMLWIVIGIIVYLGASLIDARIFRRTSIVLAPFLLCVSLLILLLVAGEVTKGAQSWFSLGAFALQPSDPMKIALILLLAKYFSRRHVEIGNIRHLIVSGCYGLIPFVLLFLQPDFGGAMIIGAIWFGMVLVSGIRKRHVALVLGGATLVGVLLWNFAFLPHQQARIMTFLDPLADIRGAGYNAYQSMIAVGSGELFGKGIGYGSQSRLSFLPEYETDFIFAAFAEEWGFVGVLIIFILLGTILYRILETARRGETNFEMLYGMGLAIFISVQSAIHIGMNIGLLPVTGLPLPFMSYGGSHIITECLALGILSSMRRYARPTHRLSLRNEFVGLE